MYCGKCKAQFLRNRKECGREEVLGDEIFEDVSHSKYSKITMVTGSELMSLDVKFERNDELREC